MVYADRFIPYRERERATETGDEPAAIPFLSASRSLMPTSAKMYRPRSRRRRRRVADNLILPQAQALIVATGADIRIGGNRAFYVPSADYLQVPPPSAFLRSDQLAPDRLP